MTLDEALRASSVAAARGFKDGKAVVSVAYYGGRLVWLTGWGGNWATEWKPVPKDEIKPKLDPLDFQPTGARQRDAYEAVLAEIFDEDFDEFEPLGDTNKEV